MQIIYLLSIISVLFSNSDTSCKHRNNRKSGVETGVVHGRIIKTIDGDTYDILVADNISIHIRMQDIDDPKQIE